MTAALAVTAHRTRDEPKKGTRRRFIVSGLLSSTLFISVLGVLRCDPADKVSRRARERLSTIQACVFLLKTSPSPSRPCSTPSKGLRARTRRARRSFQQEHASLACRQPFTSAPRNLVGRVASQASEHGDDESRRKEP